MYTFEEFCEVIQNKVKGAADDANVRLIHLQKTNDVCKCGLSVCHKGQNCCPTIYLESFYEDYKRHIGEEEIVAEILKIANANQLMPGTLDTSEIVKKENLYCGIINREASAAFLKDVPYLEFLEFAIVCYAQVEGEGGSIGSVTITKPLMNILIDSCGLTEAEIFSWAIENSKVLKPAIIKPMSDILQELMPGFVDDASIDLYVVTNSAGHKGSSVLLNDAFLAGVIEDIGDCWVLPSSLHEALLAPIQYRDDVSVIELEAMVHEINETQVSREDFLSNQVHKLSEVIAALAAIK